MVAERLEELDSLRGLAALSVVFHHFLIVLPVVFEDKSALPFLKYTPIHLFWSGGEAVTFFFVLSGFVLSLPFLAGRNVHYPSFLAKRICRIYIPYLIAIGVGLGVLSVAGNQEVVGLSAWVNRIWQYPIDRQMIQSHLVLIGRINNDAIDPVIWSLVHEMRISLVFPLLMLPVIRLNWKINLLIVGGLACAGLFIQHLIAGYPQYWNDCGLSLQYSSLFLVGALLAKNKKKISHTLRIATRPFRILACAIALGLYTYPWWFVHKSKMLHMPIINDFVVCAGVSIIISLALTPGVLSRVLNSRPVVFLGKMSYSLYLYHCLVLLACLHLLYPTFSLSAVWAISFTLTIVVSICGYYVVEVPSIAMGRYLASYMAGKRK